MTDHESPICVTRLEPSTAPHRHHFTSPSFPPAIIHSVFHSALHFQSHIAALFLRTRSRSSIPPTLQHPPHSSLTQSQNGSPQPRKLYVHPTKLLFTRLQLPREKLGLTFTFPGHWVRSPSLDPLSPPPQARPRSPRALPP